MLGYSSIKSTSSRPESTATVKSEGVCFAYDARTLALSLSSRSETPVCSSTPES